MKHILLPFLLLVGLISCSKDTIIDPTPQLLKKTWKLYSINVVTPLNGTPFEGTSPHWYGPEYRSVGSEGCTGKQLWTFQDGGKLVIQEDSSCIVPQFSGTYESTWSLSNNNKTINISGIPYGTFSYTLISVTDKFLVVQRLANVGYGNSNSIELLLQYQYSAQ